MNENNIKKFVERNIVLHYWLFKKYGHILYNKYPYEVYNEMNKIWDKTMKNNKHYLPLERIGMNFNLNNYEKIENWEDFRFKIPVYAYKDINGEIYIDWENCFVDAEILYKNLSSKN